MTEATQRTSDSGVSIWLDVRVLSQRPFPYTVTGKPEASS